MTACRLCCPVVVLEGAQCHAQLAFFIECFTNSCNLPVARWVVRMAARRLELVPWFFLSTRSFFFPTLLEVEDTRRQWYRLLDTKSDWVQKHERVLPVRIADALRHSADEPKPEWLAGRHVVDFAWL